jgi:ABC-type nickel/cobalt efflux system permease component RcnA
MMMYLVEMQRWLYGGATAGLKTVATTADPRQLLAAMAFAVLFGIVHAFMPGHGKSVLVSYYLGRPSSLLGGIVSSSLLVLTHVGIAAVLVLGGFTAVQRALPGAGRAPALEAISSGLIIAIGVWLLVRAVRGHDHGDVQNSRFLSVAAGFVPCPLTTFIMVYALAHGMVLAGLFVTMAMAGGMILTISLFALTAVMFRGGLFRLLADRQHLWHRAGHLFETASALAVIGSGVWLLNMR